MPPFPRAPGTQSCTSHTAGPHAEGVCWLTGSAPLLCQRYPLRARCCRCRGRSEGPKAVCNRLSLSRCTYHQLVQPKTSWEAGWGKQGVQSPKRGGGGRGHCIHNSNPQGALPSPGGSGLAQHLWDASPWGGAQWDSTEGASVGQQTGERSPPFSADATAFTESQAPELNPLVVCRTFLLPEQQDPVFRPEPTAEKCQGALVNTGGGGGGLRRPTTPTSTLAECFENHRGSTTGSFQRGRPPENLNDPEEVTSGPRGM